MIISGTGHRPTKLGGYGQAAFDRLVEIAKRALQELDVKSVISGMALGWDQALAQAAIELDIPFTAAIPFTGQENRWPYSSRITYAQILEHAAEVVIVSSGGYSAYKMQLRNQWMVNNSNLILAMWNGSSGGTNNCLNYARLRDKEVINLYKHLGE